VLVERLGCTVGQGYLFAPPLSGTALDARMRGATWADATS
jgi:EAL domain-containing protein (putative c-di-GMP-specific phosphodiesterase class I)